MNKLIIGLLIGAPLVLMANEYHKNLQVFTANTAKKACKTTPRLVYKGDRTGYAKSISKMGDIATESALGGAGAAAAAGVAAAPVVGLAVFGILSAVDVATSDHEYLYVTECNSGADRTRLMTLVVSNSALSEPEWTAIAQRDQARSR